MEDEKLESSSTAMTDTTNGPYKKKTLKKAPVFARPVFADEVMTQDAKERFNELPGWQRHMIKRIMDHGDLPRAAREAGVSAYVNKNIDQRIAEKKTVVEALNAGGITSEDIAASLKECLDANCMRFDKHGNVINFVDLDLKLKTLEMICRLRGDFDKKTEAKDPKEGIVELFKDTKLVEEDKQT